VFATKKNLRLLTTDGLPDPKAPQVIMKQVAGGMLVQDKDVGHVAMDDLRVVTKVQPTDAQMADLLFAWKVAKHVKSNAIVYVKDNATVGVGAGQMSRSMRDDEVIAAADEAGIAMVFTGMRHFRH